MFMVKFFDVHSLNSDIRMTLVSRNQGRSSIEAGLATRRCGYCLDSRLRLKLAGGGASCFDLERRYCSDIASDSLE